MSVLETSDEQFQKDVLDAKVPVVVDFWAQWCGPCKMLAPILEEVSKEWEGRVVVVKVNVDHNRRVATRYELRSIPTLMFFHEGRVRSVKVGALGKQGLNDWITSELQSLAS